jgi:hypothetical protein
MSQEQQPLYFPLLDTALPPSIRNLQSWIESAWEDGLMVSGIPSPTIFECCTLGFDPEGHKELKSLVGTSKWIGTAGMFNATPDLPYSHLVKDLWVAFSSRGIPFV